MNVKVSGFQWYMNGVLTLESLMSAIAAEHGTEVPFDGFQRMTYVADHDSCFSGLIITIKDQRSFYRLQGRGGGKVKISVGQVINGEHMMEVNLFVVRKDTLRGLYMHYHESLSLTGFQTFMRRYYAALRTGEIRDALHARNHPRIKALRNTPRSLNWALLTKPEGFRDLVASFEKVKAFEYPATTLMVTEPKYLPMKGRLRSETRLLRFVPNLPPKLVADDIAKFVEELGLTKGTAHVEDSEGVDRIVKLVNNPQSFAEYDFDEVAPKLQGLEADSYFDSELVERLIKIVEENEVLLTFPEG